MPSALKIVYNNAADRGTITASSAAVPATNLQTDSKSEVWRSVTGVTTATLTVVLPSIEAVACAALPFCNLSQTATMRVRLYSDAEGTLMVLDTGTKLCAQGSPIPLYGLSAAQSASAYSFGGGTAARVFFDKVNARKVVIDITDQDNLQGYLEATRLVVGDCFTTKYNVEYGAELTFKDNSENKRTDAGNLLSDIGCRYKVLKADLSILSPSERSALWKIVGYCGTSVPVFLSMLTGSADKDEELAYTVYGKFTEMSAVSSKHYLIYSYPLEVEGI